MGGCRVDVGGCISWSCCCVSIFTSLLNFFFFFFKVRDEAVHTLLIVGVKGVSDGVGWIWMDVLNGCGGVCRWMGD